MALCSVEGCGRLVLARTWCKNHYNRWYYSGDPALNEAQPPCVECGAEIPRRPSGPPATYCSRACGSRASYRRRADKIRAASRAANAAARAAKTCPCCGQDFRPPNSARQVYCSLACSKRMQNAGRRAKVRSAFVESLHWRMLYDQDGPACHICGGVTDPSDFKPGARGRIYGPGYPTLDHVVALAAGGLHERANARLAHLYCNSVKGARPLAEIA